MHRRRWLVALGTVVTAGLAGCGGSERGSGRTTPTTTSETSSETTTATPTSTTSTARATSTTATEPGSYDAERVRSSAETVSYDTLSRHSEQYVGEAVHFPYGRIDRTNDYEEYTYLRLRVADESREWEGDVEATYWGDGDVREGDVIELWGVVEPCDCAGGSNSRTTPYLTIVDYERYDRGATSGG